MQLTLPDGLSADRRAVLGSAQQRLDAEFGPKFLGLVLTGSAGRGLETPHSDLDLFVILDPEIVNGPSASWIHTSGFEQIPLTLERLETVATFDDPQWAFRWSFAWAPVLLDHTDGRIQRAIDRQTTLTVDESVDILVGHQQLGMWLNLCYRALKSARDNRPRAARLDAAESLPPFLNSVFAIAGLVRPYNKYLSWVLRHHPLADWTEEGFLSLVDEILAGDPAAVRHAVTQLTAVARGFAQTHDRPEIVEAIDDWADTDHGTVLGLFPPG